MKLAVLSLAFVFGSISLSAQSTRSEGFAVAGTTSVSATKTAWALPGAQLSRGCPMAMRLNQRISGSLRQVGRGQKRLVYAANLHLEASRATPGNTPAANVESAKVTVHGYDGSPRFELVSPGPGPLPVKQMEIRFVPQDNSGSSADFVVDGIVSASWLDVESLTFSNGTVWKPSRGESCTVRPNRFMLVGAGSSAGAAKP
ncbi:MAG TPA: hypothetical protein VF730_13685 [Terracidiphilus sp.]